MEKNIIYITRLEAIRGELDVQKRQDPSSLELNYLAAGSVRNPSNLTPAAIIIATTQPQIPNYHVI